MSAATAVTASGNSDSLATAGLLTFSGGFLDAFTFVGHGRVFANAMSGNIIFLGIAAADRDWGLALSRGLPILAFLGGVFVAHLIRLRQAPRAGLLALLLELVLLTVVALLPAAFPDVWIVLGIAFVAALQSTIFARLRGQAYNSTMTTGNLRKFAELFYAGLVPRYDAPTLRQAGNFGAVCACFLLGAVSGGLCTPLMHNPALVLPIAALAAVTALQLRRPRP